MIRLGLRLTEHGCKDLPLLDSVRAGHLEVCGDAARVKNDNAIGEFDEFLELGGHEYYRATGGSEIPQQSVEVLFRPNIYPAGRVIEQHNTWLRRQPAGYQNFLLIAAT
jgi:hypothetical protein